MKYKLYLDDMRYPDIHEDWRIARNYHDAVWYVKTYGLPYHISFDHDLADSHYDWSILGIPAETLTPPKEFTGYDFAKWFCNWVLDNQLDLSNFTYYVHSANPVGAANIEAYMKNFMRDGYV